MRLIDTNTGDFDQLRREFRWQIPENFNMAEAVCDRHAIGADRVALLTETAAGQRNRFTFAQLKEMSNRFANALRSMGVVAGDRVAIVLPQRVETGLCHLAAWKLGAISLTLSVLFETTLEVRSI